MAPKEKTVKYKYCATLLWMWMWISEMWSDWVSHRVYQRFRVDSTCSLPLLSCVVSINGPYTHSSFLTVRSHPIPLQPSRLTFSFLFLFLHFPALLNPNHKSTTDPHLASCFSAFPSQVLSCLLVCYSTSQNAASFTVNPGSSVFLLWLEI